ncbi:hypothetical protein FHS43_002485 [Streptosporangium becharense]|uniref:Uncharacterized protein n=1 Tax=Streptosporangium becharense TaxID=1816182 RepID=A0A7W9IJ83_9ACTN|nr:hypothetical protein [Streptosporangium becharense]MBB2911220.1 hypothetical protein [Streptosporangium becharense]MBB5821722.1 hypothetical protein [Streptosporangium becharense]
MGVTDFLSARRLRTGHALLLGYRPDPALLLETVRRCSPVARADRKGIRVTRKMRLRGPIDITPAIESRAGLPTGWRTAYVLEETGRDIGGPYCAPWNVVEGLARLLNGAAHPEPGPRDALASVVGCREEMSPDRLVELLAGVIPDLRVHEWADDETLVFRNGTSPIRVLAIRYHSEREGRTNIEYEMDVEDPASRTPDLFMTGELAARLIAGETGGVAQDRDGFRLPDRDTPPHTPDL